MINFLFFNNLLFIANLFFIFSCFGLINENVSLPIKSIEKILDKSEFESSDLLKKTLEGILRSEKHRLTAKIGKILKDVKNEDLRV